ncbi:MAG: CBS domain-containing protein [Selenomonadaceae bacterium]|nr:CBS domain-containing protein [Selenomonadaceae bacterium]
MFVASRMTKHPVSVTSDTTIQQADRIMKKNKFHRMLVVDNGKLVGYFSDRDIMRVAPSPATTLSKFEIRSLLDKISVKDIMHEKVITVNEGATLEEAALIMYQNKVGGLPVISDVGAVVGIITATDILKTFIKVMGLIGGKTRLTVEVDNKIGVMAEITKIFADNGVNIDSFITCRHKNNRYELVIRLDDRPEGLEDIFKILDSHGYKVIHSVKIG